MTSCKQADEHPENLDPIYADLNAQAAGLKGKAEAQKKQIEELKIKVGKYEPRDPEAKRTAHEMENLERGLLQIEQEAQYFEIRADKRRIYDKEAYLKAFRADEAWPPADEFKEYQKTKKLKHASRDWSKSVPVDKSHNRPVVDDKKKKEEKKE
jgi:hypothetical protein